MNKKMIAALITSGLAAAVFSSSAHAASTPYSGTHTGYGAPHEKEFTLNSSAKVTVFGSQNATEPEYTAICYYSVYKKVPFWFDELVYDKGEIRGNNATVNFTTSKLASGTYYLKFVCNTPSFTSGTISW